MKPDYALLGCDTVGFGMWEKRLRKNLMALSSKFKKQTRGFSENLVPIYGVSSQTTVMLVSFTVRNSNLSSHKINDARIYCLQKPVYQHRTCLHHHGRVDVCMSPKR